MKLFNVHLAYTMGALALVMGAINISAATAIPKKQVSKKGAKTAVVTTPASTASGTTSTTPATTVPATAVATGPKVTITNNLNESVNVRLTALPKDGATSFGLQEVTKTITSKATESIVFTNTTEVIALNIPLALSSIEVKAASYQPAINACRNTRALCVNKAADEYSRYACYDTERTCAAETLGKKCSELSDIIYPEDSSWSIDDENGRVVINLKD